MKKPLQQFLDDLAQFSADLKTLCNRQYVHDAVLSGWEHLRHDEKRKVPLVMSVAVHLLVLVMAITAPFLTSSSLKIPEVYHVALYRVEEAAPPAPAPRAAVSPEPTVKKTVAPPPPQVSKPETVSLSPIRQRLELERKEREVRKLEEQVRLSRLEQLKAELQQQKAEKEAREIASQAVSKLSEHLRSSTGSATGQTDTPAPAGSSSGEVDPRELEALDRYRARLFEHISPHWQLPELQNWDENLRATIIIRVTRDGTVTSSHFEKRSDNLRFNQYAMKAIENAKPFPVFPIEFRQKSEEIAVTFSPGGLM